MAWLPFCDGAPPLHHGSQVLGLHHPSALLQQGDPVHLSSQAWNGCKLTLLGETAGDPPKEEVHGHARDLHDALSCAVCRCPHHRLQGALALPVKYYCTSQGAAGGAVQDCKEFCQDLATRTLRSSEQPRLLSEPRHPSHQEALWGRGPPWVGGPCDQQGEHGERGGGREWWILGDADRIFYYLVTYICW